jgi:hypothetical protein
LEVSLARPLTLKALRSSFIPTLPLLAAFETTLFLGGFGALLKLPPPRVS